MKTKLLTVAALLCCILCAQSFTSVSNMEINKAKEKIKLEKHDSSTRSATNTLVEAYADDYIVSVSVENYTGDIYVQVYGAGGAAQTVFSCYNNGTDMLDISSLPAGTYTLSITLNNTTYTGTFVK